MGMFDEVNFDHRMPDGFLAPDAYQTKGLNCAGDTYEITPDGRLVLTYSSGYPNDVRQPLGDVHHTGSLKISTDECLGDVWHEYDLSFVDGSLRVIRCHQTGVEVVFEPSQMPTLSNEGS